MNTDFTTKGPPKKIDIRSRNAPSAFVMDVTTSDQNSENRLTQNSKQQGVLQVRVSE
jgi:hypothetical protein